MTTLQRIAWAALAISSLFSAVDAALETTKFSNRTVDRIVPLRSHTIFAPYIDQDLQNRWWDFGADAYVNTMKHIRLTRAKRSEMGWLWSRIPLSAQHYQIEVEFKMDGEPGHLFGDGLAMWLTKDRAQPGPVFGSKDNFEGLGIFIDTFANTRHSYGFPRIMAMKGDGKTSYLNGEDGDSQAAGACTAAVRGAKVATKLRLTVVKDEYVDLQVHFKAWDEWTDCFTLQNVTLPNVPYLGFSALTGDVFDNHDIISVSTSSLVILPAGKGKTRGSIAASGRQPAAASTSSNSGSRFGTFIKLLFLGVLVAIGVAAYRVYARKNSSSGLIYDYKRF